MTPLLVAFLLLAPASIPTGEAVLAQFVEVTGGKAAYAAVHTSVSTGTLEMPAQGIKGKLTVYTAEPAKEYSVAEIPGVGKLEDGTDGKIAWSNSVLQGARIKEGEERAVAIRTANFKARVNWRDFYKSIENAGVETVDGKPCYKIVMTPIEGSPETDYYDKSTGLMLKQVNTLKTPMGEVAVETTVSDYRKDGAILSAHKLKQSAVGQQFQIVIDKVEYNVELAKDRFDPPAEVKALSK